MYAWLWRRLRGRLVLRLAQVALLLLVVLAVLFTVVFPRLEPLLPVGHVTVHSGSAHSAASP